MFCGGAASVNFYSSDIPLPVHAWEAKLAMTSVLVMTAQILLNLLRAGTARLPQIAFLVFDECHHAQQAKDHPYTQIARAYQAQTREERQQTQILGLTASPTAEDTLVLTPTRCIILCHLLIHVQIGLAGHPYEELLHW